MAPLTTAIIVGYRGQDGSLLANNLAGRGYKVIGIGRGHVSGIHLDEESLDIRDSNAVKALLERTGPAEIYYLAAYHSSSEKSGVAISATELFSRSQEVHVTGLLAFLAAMEVVSPHSRLFYAASSLVFSGQQGPTQDESTPLEPVGMYGITKAQGMWLCREFRKNNIFASCGILYNHESHLRPRSFLTSKIIQAAIKIANGGHEKVEVGNLSARVDWGYAPDYVEAFRAVLNLDAPDDFIFASGAAHSVEEFIAAVFGYFSLDWRDHVIVSPNLLFREQPVKQGNAAKLHQQTGIHLARPFNEFVYRLIQDHLAADIAP